MAIDAVFRGVQAGSTLATFPFPPQCDLILPLLEMAIDAVFRGVQAPTNEPSVERRIFRVDDALIGLAPLEQRCGGVPARRPLAIGAVAIGWLRRSSVATDRLWSPAANRSVIGG
ncbi:hypothetical protein C484_07606 [Natrialba taiwanensis DSM 12281]|uniref:Uncharacterized protein n=1 Tax=Natrialba taiwanensis DSM 12281 TaxID=1230458 RepID=M0A8R5_9EURY|nr:hypothetical protein C484_07606 [Natrialba taiwanensis DSM 12281]